MDIPLAKPLVDEEQKKAVLKVLESGSFILGDEVENFEKEFSSFCHTKFGIGVNSGTSALHLALLSLDIGPGDEVITVPHTFFATMSSILYTGANVRFVDIDPETYNMDPGKLESAITKNTKAIIPVHLNGHPADMDPILEIAAKHDLSVVEDACQAHGAEYKGKQVGSMGRIACFSFYPSKNMTVCGDGGMIVTDDVKLSEKTRMLRNYGQKKKYYHEILGYNYRLSEISAAIARIQLKKLPSWNERRRKNARLYTQLFTEKGTDIILPVEKKWAKHVYHYYVIRSSRRDKLVEFLEKSRIGVGIHYPIPLHLSPVVKGYGKGNFPMSEKVAGEVLSLPAHPTLTAEQIKFIVDKITEFSA